MMIGRNINFDRARMLAIDNDIVGATNDIIQQLGSAEEFTRLNAIQRKKLASAIGVEVGELSRLVAGKPLEITAKEQETKLQKESIGQMEELTKAMKELKNVISAGGKGLLGKKGDSTPTQTSDESNKELMKVFKQVMNG